MSVRIDLETKHALKDVQDYTRERGKEIKIYPNLEEDVTREIFNSIKKTAADPIKMKAFITKSPNRYQLEKAGITETVDALATFATKDFTEKDLTYSDIDIARWELQLPDGKYRVKDKSETNQFGEVYLNIVIGLVPK